MRRRKPDAWLLVVNAAAVSTGPMSVRRVIRRVKRMRRPAIVFLSEVADVRVAELVDSKTWQVVQFGTLGSAESGTALMVRRSKARVRGDRLFLASPAIEGIRTRWATAGVADLWLRGQWVPLAAVAASHVPPRRAPEGQHLHARTLEVYSHSGATIVGADWNMGRREVAARLALPITQVRMIEVLGIAANGLEVGRARARRVFSDHPGVTVPVWAP